MGYLGEIGWTLGITIPFNSPIVNTWTNMLKRCFCNPAKSYKDVTVCEAWKNLSIFYSWMVENQYELDGEHTELDKDIKIPGNRIYSPDTCLIVPSSVNKVFRRNNSVLTPTAIRRYIDMYRGLVPEKVIAAMSSWVERLEAEKPKVAAAD